MANRIVLKRKISPSSNVKGVQKGKSNQNMKITALVPRNTKIKVKKS